MATQYTYALPLTKDEADMLHRVLCSGIVGGNKKVRSALYDKLVELKKHITAIDGTKIDGKAYDVTLRVPARSLRSPEGRNDRAKGDTARQDAKGRTPVGDAGE